MICYQIGGIGIGFNIQIPIRESTYYGTFRIKQNAFEELKEKESVEFYMKKPEVRNLEKIIYDTKRKRIGFYKDNYITYYHRYPKREYYSSFERNLQTGKGTIYFSPNCMSDLSETSDLFDLADMISLWLKYKIIMLHSSFLIYKDKAVLFTGPSGVGKSTQAELWKNELGAEIINGDRSLLRREEDGWKVYGVPNCGSSAISLNKSAKLAGIVLLEQGNINQVVKPSFIEAYRQILTQIVMNRYNEKECVDTMELIEYLIKEVTIRKLSCLPDKEAVALVKEELGF